MVYFWIDRLVWVTDQGFSLTIWSDREGDLDRLREAWREMESRTRDLDYLGIPRIEGGRGVGDYYGRSYYSFRYLLHPAQIERVSSLIRDSFAQSSIPCSEREFRWIGTDF